MPPVLLLLLQMAVEVAVWKVGMCQLGEEEEEEGGEEVWDGEARRFTNRPTSRTTTTITITTTIRTAPPLDTATCIATCTGGCTVMLMAAAAAVGRMAVQPAPLLTCTVAAAAATMTVRVVAVLVHLRCTLSTERATEGHPLSPPPTRSGRACLTGPRALLLEGGRGWMRSGKERVGVRLALLGEAGREEAGAAIDVPCFFLCGDADERGWVGTSNLEGLDAVDYVGSQIEAAHVREKNGGGAAHYCTLKGCK